MEFRTRGVSVFLLATWMFPAALGLAATKTAKFNVTATVQSDCTVTATNLAFGTVGLLQANVDATSTISVTCTPNTPYQLGLNEGTAAGSTVDARLMANGTATMQFQMFSDAQRTQIWGNTDGTNTVGGSGNGQAANYTVYGRIPPQTAPGVGNYATEITATITY
jgi:spore coat protein U-like protein